MIKESATKSPLILALEFTGSSKQNCFYGVIASLLKANWYAYEKEST